MAPHAHVLSCLAKGMIKEKLRATPQSNLCMVRGYLMVFPPLFRLVFLKQYTGSDSHLQTYSTKSNTIISSIQKMAQVIAPAPMVQSKIFLDGVPTAAPAPPSTTHPSTPEIAYLPSSLNAPFSTIRQLFDHLRSNPHLAASLNSTYPLRGVFKTAATSTRSPTRNLLWISHIRVSLESPLH